MVAALVAVSFATLGGGVWPAFADSMTFIQTVVLEQDGTGWEKIQSVFSRDGFTMQRALLDRAAVAVAQA